MPNRRRLSKRQQRHQREDAARREIRRADVIAAASAVFAEKGFHEAQISEIARAAELSRKSVYALFEGKDEIYQAVISTAVERMREEVVPKVEAIPDAAQRLLGLVDLLFLCFDENRDLLRTYERGTRGLPWRLRQAMGDSAQLVFHNFTAWVASLASAAKEAGHLGDLDPLAVARSLVGSVTTTAAQWLENTPDKPLSQAAPAVRAIFERLLAPGRVPSGSLPRTPASARAEVNRPGGTKS